ncbi:MAG: iron-sulfur cluster loop [Ignisphaera sp.]
MPYIDIDKVKYVARFFTRLDAKPMDLFDTRFYPKSNEPLDNVLMYFLTMVAMDHRLSRPSRPYKAVVDGEEYKGADLLYRLGMKMYISNPYFFSPENLSKISEKDILAWLSVGTASPPDPQIRAILLRDLGVKILQVFNGDPKNIIRVCGGYLRREDGLGLLDILRMFKAYSDPVEKKSMLLVKFLSYRGLFKVVDVENIRVPVDNHLSRIALRLGLIVLEKHLEDKIFRGEEVSYDEDIIIRYSVREAYRNLSIYTNLSVFHLDDFLWSFGRTICIRDSPQCLKCYLRNVCRSYEIKVFLNEHSFYNTWYY